jgi:hypothetical protein
MLVTSTSQVSSIRRKAARPAGALRSRDTARLLRLMLRAIPPSSLCGPPPISRFESPSPVSTFDHVGAEVAEELSPVGTHDHRAELKDAEALKCPRRCRIVNSGLAFHSHPPVSDRQMWPNEPRYSCLQMLSSIGIYVDGRLVPALLLVTY